MKKIITRSVIVALSSIILAFGIFTGVRCYDLANTTEPVELSRLDEARLEGVLSRTYPEQYKTLKSLPYSIPKQELDVWAESAIIINASNGNVLYEKNADEIIPPASMTKLFAMYVVDEEVSAGRLSYDQIIPLPPETWACNMPPHSSLMFLGEGQKVTLEEVLLGLSIASGNDAAYALAYTVCGNMEDFVQRMNKVAADLGLEHTHFVESSGYSELNTTTAREMAEFSKIYLEKHPDSLKKFHAVPSFTYPKERNLADGDFVQAQDFSMGLPARITMPITQENTNPLLGKLRGCDGLKTGYIDESGYNLSLTAARDGSRFISVTMRGPGNGSAEGQAGRVHDGTELMEWAFGSFANMEIDKWLEPRKLLALNGSEKMINLVPAYPDKDFTVPFIAGDTMEENLGQVKVDVTIPDYVWGQVDQGATLGGISISIGDYKLAEIPLVSDRKIENNNFLYSLADKIYLLFN